MSAAGLQHEPLPAMNLGPLLKEMQNSNEAPAARSRAMLARRGRAIDSYRRCVASFTSHLHHGTKDVDTEGQLAAEPTSHALSAASRSAVGQHCRVAA